MTVLPDTSVWVDYLQRGAEGPARALDRLLAEEAVLVCGPVLAELLAGTVDEDREELWHALGALPWAELDHEGWRRVGELAHELRQAGLTLPLTDIEIAVACAASGAALWSRDDDFQQLHPYLPSLELYEST
ncbi:MAG TPA: PIN domain-containing protein [Gaiellaceae bacterium]|nr:PIN domain-containing protein [Gaiellaceae bacterium]